MAFVKKKPVSVIDDLTEEVRTSRPYQLIILISLITLPIVLVAILIIWHFWAAYSGRVEAEQKQAQEQAQAVASVISLFHFVSAPAGKQSVVLAVNSDNVPTDLREELANGTQMLLSTKYPTSAVLPDVILPVFYSNGYFDKAFAGDLGFLDTAQFFQHENVLVLIQPHIEFKDINDASGVTGMRSCTISLTCRAYTATNVPYREVRLDAVGAAHSDEASFQASLQALQQNGQVDTLLAP